MPKFLSNGDGVPPCVYERERERNGGGVQVRSGKVSEVMEEQHSNLLHVSQDVFAAVEHSFTLLRVQVKDEVCCVVGVTLLIPVEKRLSVNHRDQ